MKVIYAKLEELSLRLNTAINTNYPVSKKVLQAGLDDLMLLLVSFDNKIKSKKLVTFNVVDSTRTISVEAHLVKIENNSIVFYKDDLIHHIFPRIVEVYVTPIANVTVKKTVKKKVVNAGSRKP